MIHYMNLVPSAFKKIADGSKTIELRLNDEKRQQINVGDTIIFNNISAKDIIRAQVVRLHKFSDFEELYKALPLEKCGYTVAELDTAHYTDMEQYYSKEQIKKYGALGIELCNVFSICDIKEIITGSDILKLLAPSVFNPTEERLLNRAKKYQEDENTNIYAYKDNGEHKGIVIFKIANNSATILDIAVKPDYQGQGIGSKLIDFIFNSFNVNNITAETDDDAIGFYKKYGFTVANTKVEFDTKRYVCVCESVTHHYDLLIDENNDPVHDSKPLQDYMDKWDGQVFIDKMELNKNKSVLEIGVGTGRLAVRVAPLCGEFYGVDISPKTIERAKDNLAKLENVSLTCADFLSYKFGRTFDVVYSSLTFMHIKEKQKTINKVAALLEDGGKFVLSIDKNQDRFIDTGTRKVTIYPDTPEEIKTYIANSSLLLTECYETEFAHIFSAKKECKCYCGHDCARCITYIATQKNDDNLRRQSQRFYKERFCLDISLEKFNCEGGRSQKVFELCKECPFVKCCKERSVDFCSKCPEYPCKEISDYQAKYVNKCNQL